MGTTQGDRYLQHPQLCIVAQSPPSQSSAETSFVTQIERYPDTQLSIGHPQQTRFSHVAQAFRNPWRPWFNTIEPIIIPENSRDSAQEPKPSTSTNNLRVRDVVEGRVSFNLKEHLFLFKDLFRGRCPVCYYDFIVEYQACTQLSFPVICSRPHLQRVIRFKDSIADSCFKHKSHFNIKDRQKCTTAEQFFSCAGKKFIN